MALDLTDLLAEAGKTAKEKSQKESELKPAKDTTKKAVDDLVNILKKDTEPKQTTPSYGTGMNDKGDYQYTIPSTLNDTEEFTPTLKTKSRNDFDTDEDYNKYIVGNKINTWQDENARDYVLDKAKEYDMSASDYASWMTDKTKTTLDAESVRTGVENGEYSDEQLEGLNNKFFAVLDSDGNEITKERYDIDSKSYTANAGAIDHEISMLNTALQNGDITREEYEKQYASLTARWNENEAVGERLRNANVIKGFDYYDWAKDNGKDVTDFEKYAESLNDSSFERLGELYKASWIDMANTIPQVYGMARMLLDEDYDYTKDGTLQTKLANESSELREYAYNGSKGFQYYSLQTLESLMPMTNAMLLGMISGGALGMTGSALSGFTGTFTNVALGMQGAGQTTRENLNRGVNLVPAVINGAIHGTITGLVEGFDAGRVASVFTGEAGNFLMSMALLGKANPKLILQSIHAMGVAEATEELIEGIADRFADEMQNLIFSAFTTDPSYQLDLEPITWQSVEDMALQMGMAYVGSYILGAPMAGKVVINSNKTYNASMTLRNYFQSVVDSELEAPESKKIAMEGIRTIDEGMKEFDAKSAVSKAVTLADERATYLGTFDEAINNFVNGMQPDASMEVIREQEIIKKSMDLKSLVQNGLDSRGIDILADDYVNLSEEGKQNIQLIDKEAKELGLDVSYTTAMVGDGFYNPKTGKIVLNPDSKLSTLSTLVHEITHGTESSGKFYGSLAQMVKNELGDKFDPFVERIQNEYRMYGQDLNTAQAEKEAVAIRTQELLGNQKFVDRLVRYNSSLAYRLYEGIKNFMAIGGTRQKLESTFMKAFRNMDISQQEKLVPQYSMGTTFQSVGMEIKKFGDHIEATKNGKPVSIVSRSDVMDSPLGRFLESSNKRGVLTQEEINKQADMYAGLCNSLLRTQDPDLIWAITGAIGYAPLPENMEGQVLSEDSKDNFSALKTNADKQYRWTFDVTTICNKTQQLIDSVSKAMIKLDRGLTRDEMINIAYKTVYDAGEPVPCPVCYVFSKWVGIGETLDRMNKMQKTYAQYSTEQLQERYNELSKEVAKIGNAEVQKKLENEYDNLLNKQIKSQMGEGEFTAKQEKRLEQLKLDIGIVQEWKWIGNVRLKESYQPVPADILFDLNKGNEFATRYPDSWAWRKERGQSIGKTITPYSSEVLGQSVYGIASPSDISNLNVRRTADTNAFLNPTDENEKDRDKVFKNAIKNARVQNLIGGTRLQTTSDFRFEYLLDYIMFFTELGAINSYAQTYTKVPEFVPISASVGVETNMSLMPKGKGYVEAKPGEKNAIKMGDKWYKLDFSNVTGMNADDAFHLASIYDRAQPIIVGINDTHMWLCMNDDRITFIIPYHSSGGTPGRYQSMMRTVGEDVSEEDRKPYDSIQNDKEIKNPTDFQKRCRELRMKILMGNAEKLTKSEKETIKESKFLGQLWDRFYVDGLDPECRSMVDGKYEGNFSTKAVASQVFPYEYWDKTLTAKDADMNGQRFLDYCEELGLTPRFEKFSRNADGTVAHGYWKTLIDRPMYNNDGSYHYQTAVDLSKMSIDWLDYGKLQEGVVQPTRMFDRSKTQAIADSIVAQLNGVQFSHGLTSDQDTDGRKLTKAQLNYFRYSKAVDENGRLVTVYHGTDDYGFTVFDPKSKKNRDKISIFFTSNPITADSYAESGLKYECYLNITNPLVIDGLGANWNELPNIIAKESAKKYNNFDTLQDWADFVRDQGGDPEEMLRYLENLSERHDVVFVNGKNPGERLEFTDRWMNPDTTASYLRDFLEDNNLDPYAVDEYFAMVKSDMDYSSVDYVTKTREWARYAYDNGFDGVIIKDIFDVGKNAEWEDMDDDDTRSKYYADIYVVFNSNQIKEVSNRAPTKNPDIQFSRGMTSEQIEEGLELNQEAIEEHGRFEPGRNAVREVNIAKATDEGKTSQFARNIAGSGRITDEIAKEVEAMTGKGWYSYEKVNNKETHELAVKVIRKFGMKNTYEYLMNADRLSTAYLDTAIGAEYLSEMRRMGVIDEKYYDVLYWLSDRSPQTAQALQEYSTFRKLAPDQQIITIQSEIKRLQKGLDERYGKGKYNIEITDEINNLVQEYVKETDVDKRDKIGIEIAKSIAEQMPHTLMEQMNSFRHLAMLCNPRSWAKNYIANTVFGYINEATRAIRSGMEQIAVNYGKEHGGVWAETERQAGAYNPASEEDRSLYKLFVRDYEKHFADQNEGKYTSADTGVDFILDDEFGKMIEENRDQFTPELLNKINEFNAKMMSDKPAMSRAYAKTMVGYFKANGLDVNTVNDEQLEKAREFAYEEAKYATFNTKNKLASALVRLYNQSPVLGKIAIEATVPFKRTPFNLLMTGARYSPAGLLWSISANSYLLSKGMMSPNRYINNLAQGLTGTGIAILGMLLARLGIFRVKDDDSDRKQAYDNALGEQNYSIKIGNYNYTIDWMDPTVVPLAIGAEAMRAIENGGFSLDRSLDLIFSVAEPMFETSMLSGIKSNLTSYSNSEGGYWKDIFQNMVANYVSQYLPTAFGAFNRTIDETRRTTYPAGFLEKTARTLLGKIPVGSFLNQPYINVKGETEKNAGGNILGRAILNFLSPGFLSKEERSKTDKEAYRLYDKTGDENAFPSKSTKSFNYNDVKYTLSYKEYTNYNKDRFSKENQLVTKFMGSSLYKSLSDDERISVIEDLRKYAGYYANERYLKTKGVTFTNKEYDKVKEAEKTGLTPAEYYVSKDYYNSLSGDQKKAEFFTYISDSNMTYEQKNAMVDTYYGTSKFTQYVNSSPFTSEEKYFIKEMNAMYSDANDFADALKQAGLFNDYVQYCKDNNIEYGTMGLNKTIANGGSTRDRKKNNNNNTTETTTTTTPATDPIGAMLGMSTTTTPSTPTTPSTDDLIGALNGGGTTTQSQSQSGATDPIGMLLGF